MTHHRPWGSIHGTISRADEATRKARTDDGARPAMAGQRAQRDADTWDSPCSQRWPFPTYVLQANGLPSRAPPCNRPQSSKGDFSRWRASAIERTPVEKTKRTSATRPLSALPSRIEPSTSSSASGRSSAPSIQLGHYSALARSPVPSQRQNSEVRLG